MLRAALRRASHGAQLRGVGSWAAEATTSPYLHHDATVRGDLQMSPAGPSGPGFLRMTWDGDFPFRSTWDKLFRERIILVVGDVNEAMAYDVTTKLLLMEAAHPRKPIYMYINSHGGNVADGLAIYDTMQFVQPHIYTVGVGKCMSMGAVLLAAGQPGKRLILPHTKVMVHQPLGGVQGSSTNMEAAVESMVDYRNKLKQILMKHCSQSAEAVDKAFVTDTYFDAERAVEWGLVDEVVKPRKWVPTEEEIEEMEMQEREKEEKEGSSKPA